jgi:PAS domain S-box-containing protein
MVGVASPYLPLERKCFLTPLKAFTLTILICVLAVLITFYFGSPFFFLLIAAMTTSLFLGRNAGLFAIALLTLALYYFILEPKFHLVRASSDVGRLAVFAGATIFATEMIDAKRRSDRSRLQREMEFRAVAETCPDCILIVDEQQIIRFVNPAISKMFSYSKEEVIGKPVSLLLPELSFRGSPAGEFRALHKNGDEFHVESTCGRFSDKTTIFLRDITDRKLVQAQLESSEANLRLTLDTIPGLVYTRSPNGEIEYANLHLTEHFGYTLEDVQRGAWIDGLHPDERESVLAKTKVDFALGKAYTIICRRRIRNGTYRWFHTTVEPLIGSDGQVIRWYGLITDIDDRRRAEESLRQTQTKLSQAAQIATASELSASIVHEISQPIAAMVANGQSCLRWLGMDPPNHDNAKAAVERIVRDGKDARDIIKGLRNLFKRSAPEKSSVELRKIVEEVLVLVNSRTQKEDIQVDVQIAPDLPPVSGDPIQLQQVLLNLVSNAIDAMHLVVGRPKNLMLRARLLGEGSILTEIEDCGTGISDHEKVFETFFTTKESGMGMGLSICKTIVMSHGGRLWATSASESGTVFSFTIPSEPKAS